MQQPEQNPSAQNPPVQPVLDELYAIRAGMSYISSEKDKVSKRLRKHSNLLIKQLGI